MSREIMKRALDWIETQPKTSTADNICAELRAELSKPEQQPTLFFGRAVYFADPKTGEIKNEVMECLQ